MSKQTELDLHDLRRAAVSAMRLDPQVRRSVQTAVRESYEQMLTEMDASDLREELLRLYTDKRAYAFNVERASNVSLFDELDRLVYGTPDELKAVLVELGVKVPS